MRIIDRLKAAGRKTNPTIHKNKSSPKLDVKGLTSPLSGKKESIIK